MRALIQPCYEQLALLFLEVPEAALILMVPDDEGLSIQPESGNRSVDAAFSLISRVSKNPVIINAKAMVGRRSVSAWVTVEIPNDYLMEFF